MQDLRRIKDQEAIESIVKVDWMQRKLEEHSNLLAREVLVKWKQTNKNPAKFPVVSVGRVQQPEELLDKVTSLVGQEEFVAPAEKTDETEKEDAGEPEPEKGVHLLEDEVHWQGALLVEPVEQTRENGNWVFRGLDCWRLQGGGGIRNSNNQLSIIRLFYNI